MPKSERNAGHHSFLETVRVLYNGAGAAYAAESLVKTGVSAGKQANSFAFETPEQFYESMEHGDNPITDFEGHSVHFGDGVFGLPACPFAPSLEAYVEAYGDQRAFREVTVELNKPTRLTRELRVGEGAALNPFCVMHQPVRSAMGQRVTVGGRPLLVYQLGCKTPHGTKGIAWRYLREANVSRELVDKVLEDHCCCFCFRLAPTG